MPLHVVLLSLHWLLQALLECLVEGGQSCPPNSLAELRGKINSIFHLQA
jgi:hypothetical protein